ncbi:hypothetical protein [Bosea sp. (in: a-proteobacteria)]|uniref:hypothetical protein n=1 Tax=Bosea sp. (in: a-proteobacteria) TaxID=1871050 RepID=UPI002618080F|nr:hypothetical protein [Bosea sp. (in: a-proteobacteria)]MCO5092612.1 hypothetical protein [Bosea sp. (in: a-proteobacteria)]
MAKAWIAWSRWFLLAALAAAGLVFAFVAALDPFGMRVHAGDAARPIMDINQRFMYPQLVRSGRFDAAVIGTSTMRLVDPQALSRGLDARFVNLAMNAATPWEQMEMARLFRAHVRVPRRLIWGIDTTWCEADATDEGRRLTPRPVPAWFSREVAWSDWPKLLNLTNLEIAGRLLAHRLGWSPARIRGDGYEVFTPPEASYDLIRAQAHIYASLGGRVADLAPLSPPASVAPAESARWRFPALSWLEESIMAFPKETQVMLVLPPAHLAAYPREGSPGWQRYARCKAEIAALARRHGATLVDYAHASPITTQDANYWDPLHFRLPVAARFSAELVAIASGGAPGADGAANVLR